MGTITHPPPFISTVAVAKKFRFSASAAGTCAITNTSLLDLLFVATAANAGHRIVNAFRVRRVTAWGPMDATLAPVTVSVEWDATTAFAGKSVIHSDTSMGSTTPAHVSSAPPANCLAGFWSGSTSAVTLFTLVLPANAIVDVQLDFVLRDAAAAVVVQRAVAGATVGVLYMSPLDSSGASLLTPVSYATI